MSFAEPFAEFEGRSSAEFKVGSSGFPPADPVPAECPGLVVEQPLERWSLRELIVSMLRLVRWTRLATS